MRDAETRTFTDEEALSFHRLPQPGTLALAPATPLATIFNSPPMHGTTSMPSSWTCTHCPIWKAGGRLPSPVIRAVTIRMANRSPTARMTGPMRRAQPTAGETATSWKASERYSGADCGRGTGGRRDSSYSARRTGSPSTCHAPLMVAMRRSARSRSAGSATRSGWWRRARARWAARISPAKASFDTPRVR